MPYEDCALAHGALARPESGVQSNSRITYQSDLVLVLAYDVMQLQELLA